VTDAARASLWVSASTVFVAFVAWLLSFYGGSSIYLVFGRLVPWGSIGLGTLLWWQALGLAIVFLLALLAVRLWSAPPWLWLGALAASTLLAGRYFIGFLEVEAGRPFGPYADMEHLLYSRPFHNPYVTLFALVGYPLAMGLGCFVGSRLLARQGGAHRSESMSHA
jgi:hypothetical protein